MSVCIGSNIRHSPSKEPLQHQQQIGVSVIELMVKSVSTVKVLLQDAVSSCDTFNDNVPVQALVDSAVRALNTKAFGKPTRPLHAEIGNAVYGKLKPLMWPRAFGMCWYLRAVVSMA
jgi:hypothetical protein